MNDFRIDPDSPFGKEIGFTSNLFDGWLWREGRTIYISFIESKQESRGNFRKLVMVIRLYTSRANYCRCCRMSIVGRHVV